MNYEQMKVFVKEFGEWSEPHLCLIRGQEYVVACDGGVAVLVKKSKFDGPPMEPCANSKMWECHYDRLDGSQYPLDAEVVTLLSSPEECSECGCSGVVSAPCPHCGQEWESRQCARCEGAGTVYGREALTRVQIGGAWFRLNKLSRVAGLPGFRCMVTTGDFIAMVFTFDEGFGIVTRINE